MATCPSTPPRRTRAETPEAPLHGAEYDKGKRRERKERELEKARQREDNERQKEKARVCPPTSSKAKSSVSFAPSPPGSPVSTGFPSPVQDKFDIFRDDTQSTTNADPFIGPSHSSTTKYKKFKPPPAPQNMRNPFAPEEASQESTGAESLPTPAKTPSRKRKFMIPSEEQEELDSATRVLFPDRTASKPKTPISSAAAATLAEILGEPSSSILGSSKTSTRKKSSSKLDLGRDVARDLFGSGNILGSGDSGSIEIFTDSNARVPEYDPRPENPFIDHPEGSARQLTDKQREKERKRRERIQKNREEFETLRAGREDGMVYTFRGMKAFRKFDEDSSRVLNGPVQRVLFPSARGTRSGASRTIEDEAAHTAAPIEGFLGGASDDDDEIDHFAAIFESDNAPSTPTKQSKRKTTIEKLEKKVEEKAETVIAEEVKVLEEKTDDEEEAEKNDEEKFNEAKGREEEKVEPETVDLGEQPDKRTRAPSVAPSVSSVASSNILSFGRRPRITKSVSNLSNGEGKTPALRRSKRLASVEPEPIPEVGKTTIKQKLASKSKRSRSEDSALEDTGKWALEVQEGSRKKSRY